MPLGLALADGSRWRVEAADPRAGDALERLRQLARLRADHPGPALRLRVWGESAAAGGHRDGFVVAGLSCDGRAPTIGEPPAAPGEINCHLPPAGDFPEAALALKILNVPAYHALLRHGLLLHAALVAHAGRGFLLAGRSGAGKSTASARVPPGWEALSDDMALVVRAPGDGWRVHPWPTWGAVINGVGGSWPVERALPLEGIFFLEQAPREDARRLGGGQSACLLNESAEDASWLVGEGMAAAAVRALRLRQFETLALLAREVPCHRLRLSLGGAYWETVLSAALVAA